MLNKVQFQKAVDWCNSIGIDASRVKFEKARENMMKKKYMKEGKRSIYTTVYRMAKHKERENAKREARNKKNKCDKLEFGVIDIEQFNLASAMPNVDGATTTRMLCELANQGVKFTHIYSLAYTDEKGNFIEHIQEYDKAHIFENLLTMKPMVYFGGNTSRFDNIPILQYLIDECGYKIVEHENLKEGEIKLIINNSNSILNMKYHNKLGIVDIRDILRLTSTNVDKTIQSFTDSKKVDVSSDPDFYNRFIWSKLDIDDLRQSYNEGDVVPLYHAIKKLEEVSIENFGNNILNFLTIGAYAMSYHKEKLMKKMGKEFFELTFFDHSNTLDLNFKGGGYTYCNRANAYETHKNVITMDIVSMYPSIMNKAKLPLGNLIQHRRDVSYETLVHLLNDHPTDYFFVKMVDGLYHDNNHVPYAYYCEEEKNAKHPTSYHVCSKKAPVYLQDSILRYAMQTNSKIVMEQAIFEIWEFQGLESVFQGSIDEIVAKKQEFKKTNEPLSYLYKIMANSSYGKLLQAKETTKYKFENGVIALTNEKEDTDLWYQSLQMGSAITAHARFMLANNINLVHDSYIIGDTDSMYMRTDIDDVDTLINKINENAKNQPLFYGMCQIGNKLGDFEFNREQDTLRHLTAYQSKTYDYVDNSGKRRIVFCGIRDTEINHLSTQELLEQMERGFDINVTRTTIVPKNGVVFYQTVTKKGNKNNHFICPETEIAKLKKLSKKML